MYKVICVVCNYNKQDFVVNCVKSIKEQSMDSILIIVADNASTDDSVEQLRNSFGESVIILQNSENKGGSGGFNLGLREALRHESEYIMLIDNDVVLDKHAIEIMYDYMNVHKEIGILGPTVRMMKNPEKVQDLGGSIGNRYNMYGNYFADIDEGLPCELEVDYISTCAAMARTTAVKEFGLMPEDNFIYWDDVEWSKKCQLAGYKTVAINKAKVWHNFQTANVTAFNKYYLLRNRLHFFARYISDEKIDDFIQVMLEEIFFVLYGYKSKKSWELFNAIIYGLDDFIHEVRGKADEYKIQPIRNRKTPFEEVVTGKKVIKINLINNFSEESETEIYSILLYIIKNIVSVNKESRIIVSLEGTKYTTEDFNKNLAYELDRCTFREILPEISLEKDNEEFELVLQLCKHVREVEDEILPKVYVDRYCNCISNEQEYKYFKMFEEMKEFFIAEKEPLFGEAVRKIRDAR